MGLWLAGCNSNPSDSGTEGTDTPVEQDGVPQRIAGTNSRPPGSTAADFPTFFNEALVGRGSDKIEEALAAVVHPTHGIFVVHKPGAVPKPDFCKNVEELKKVRMSIVEDFARITKEVKEGDLPFYDCDTFDKEGSYFVAMPQPGSVLHDTYKDMAEMMSIDLPAAELDAAKQQDGRITHVAVSTDAGMQLGFGQIDGRWYLLSIDVALYDCGA
jgi:hypothetical protein